MQLYKSDYSLLSLDLSHFGIQANQSSGVLHSLTWQSGLTSISLRGNVLLDVSMKHLATALPHLNSLASLDLSCTGITGRGLHTLSQASMGSPLLRRLDLSYNELGPSAGFSLSSILLKNPKLSALILDDCGLTDYVYQDHSGILETLRGWFYLRYIKCTTMDTACCMYMYNKSEWFVVPEQYASTGSCIRWLPCYTIHLRHVWIVWSLLFLQCYWSWGSSVISLNTGAF